MNTKGIKFLAVLAVLAMAFAAVAVFSSADNSDAADIEVGDLKTLKEKIADAKIETGTEYVLLMTAAIPLTENIEIPANVTLKTGDNALTVNDKMTLTNNGKILVTGTGKLDVIGTLKNAGTVDAKTSAYGLTITGTVTNNGSGKGIVNLESTADEPITKITAGTFEKQVVTVKNGNDCVRVTEPVSANVVIKDNDFIVNSPHCIQVAANSSSATSSTVTISNNTFTQHKDANFISSYVLVGNGADALAASLKVSVKSNTFSEDTIYEHTLNSDKLDTASIKIIAIGAKIGKTLGDNVNVAVDDDVMIAFGSTPADTTKVINESITFSYFGIRDNNTVNVPYGVTLTLTGDLQIEDGGKLSNVGTTVVSKAADALKVYNETVEQKTGVTKIAGYDDELPAAIETTTPITEDTFGDKDVIYSIGAITKAEVPGKKALIVASPNSLTEVKVGGEGAQIALLNLNGTNDIVVKQGTNTAEFKNIKGNVTITMGSIYIDGEITGGTIELSAGAKVELTGSIDAVEVTADVTIKMTEADKNKTAEVTIAEGKTVSFNNDTYGLTIGKGITLNVVGDIVKTADGKLTIEKGATVNVAGGIELAGIVNKGTLNVQDEGIVDSAISGSGKVNAYDGSTVIGEYSGDDGDDQIAAFVAYGGSDINGVTVDEYNKITGKDANGGTWSWDADNSALILTGYKGNYNFKGLYSATITSIVLSGDSELEFTMPEVYADGYALFGNALASIATKQGEGSLLISVDASEAGKASIEGGVAYIINSTAAKFEIDSVSLGVMVSGTNATWDAKKINFVGIKAGTAATNTLDMDNSKVAVSVLTAYSASDMLVGGFLAAGDITMNKSGLTVVSGGYGVDANKITLKNESGMAVSGNAWGLSSDDKDGVLDVKGSSTAIIGNGAELKKLDVSQNSTVTVDSLIVLEGAANKVTNNGVINLTGTSAIGLGATFENDYELNVAGTLNVFGKLINKEGTTTNDGTITVFAKKIATAGLSFDMTPKEITSTGKVAQIDDITIDEADVTVQIDGSLKIDKATVTFKDNAAEPAAITPSTGYGTYTGTLTTTQSTEYISYTLNLTSTSDAPMKSSIVISYDASADADKQYTISLSGKIKGTVDAVESEYTLSKPTTPVVKDDNIVENITTIDDNVSTPKVAKAFITVEGGKIVNNSIVNYYGTVGTTVLAKGAGYEGNLNTGIQEITIGGKLKGDVTAGGKVVLTKDGNVEGMIAALGGVDSAGTIKGNIYAESAVKVKNLEGDVNIIRDADEDELMLTVNGKVSGNVKYVTEYFATKGAETKTVYTASLTLDADLSATATKTMIIDMLPGKSATETTAVVPGYFAFGTTLDEPANGKNVNITVTEGKFAFPADKPIPVRYAMTYEAGTIVEVAAVATADFSNAALKVSKDATSNFVTGTSPVTDYGVVKCIMSFSVEDGAYTIYSDVAYAVANCEEGSTLVVEAKEAPINNTILIPKDVKVVVGNGSTMSFGANGLYMSEGAQITLVGTAKVTFTETGKEATTEIVYTVNGTFEYDGNFLNFDGVRFSAASEVSGVAATTTEASKIKVNLTYKDGKATIAGGYGTGSIALQNGTEPKYKDAEPTAVYGTFVVGAEAVFDAVSITDSYASVKYKKVDDVWTISETLLEPTVVGVEGTLNLKNTTEVKGLYAGFGKVTLAEGKSLKLLKGDAYKADEAKDAPGSLNLYVVDTTEESNGYLFSFVSPKVGEEDIILTATKKTLEGEKLDVMTIKGGVRVGAINATTEAVLDDFDVGDEAMIYGDVVFVIADSTADGYVGAKTIYMDKTGYGKLKYQATFVKDDYTIYTKFAAIDWDEITDVTIEKGEVDIEKKLDLSGKDVNISIGKDATFTLDAVMIIGTPITVIGDEGSSIVGKIIINGDNYLVAYADVDLSEAEIIGENNKDAAFSKLDVENVPYAAIFAQDYEDTIKLSKADATIIPEIVGYNFTAWINYNGDAGATVGETNAYADSAAVLVTVLVKYVAGVDYYMNGSLFDAYNIYTDVPYGSYFTAKISDTTKYQGNPLINGEKTVCVIDDMTLEASGVTPIPEPTPEPVEENTGLSLTDILLIVLVILIAIMVVILVLRLNRS